MGRLLQFGKFGFDRPQARVGPAVVGVPPLPLVALRAELFDGPLALDDPSFGPSDVAGEGFDLIEGRGLLLPAVAAEQ